MIISREQIAALIRGHGLNNNLLSALTRVRAAEGKGVYVSSKSISGYLQSGSQGSDLKNRMVNSLIEALMSVGGRFGDDNWVRIDPGALSRTHSELKEKKEKEGGLKRGKGDNS